jgi:hypothetical protein
MSFALVARSLGRRRFAPGTPVLAASSASWRLTAWALRRSERTIAASDLLITAFSVRSGVQLIGELAEDDREISGRDTRVLHVSERTIERDTD